MRPHLQSCCQLTDVPFAEPAKRGVKHMNKNCKKWAQLDVWSSPWKFESPCHKFLWLNLWRCAKLFERVLKIFSSFPLLPALLVEAFQEGQGGPLKNKWKEPQHFRRGDWCTGHLKRTLWPSMRKQSRTRDLWEGARYSNNHQGQLSSSVSTWENGKIAKL